MVRISWPWPQVLKKEEEDKSSSNFSTSGKKLSKEEAIKGRVELMSHNVEMDKMFNRG